MCIRDRAKPLTVIKRTSRKADFAQMKTLTTEHQVERLLFGLPLHLDGNESQMSRWVRNYSAEASEVLGIPAILYDESFSSQNAEERMAMLGYGKKKKRTDLDAHAAAVFLQNYLDENRSSEIGPIWFESIRFGI